MIPTNRSPSTTGRRRIRLPVITPKMKTTSSVGATDTMGADITSPTLRTQLWIVEDPSRDVALREHADGTSVVDDDDGTDVAVDHRP
jgi:hypothetical protein